MTAALNYPFFHVSNRPIKENILYRIGSWNRAFTLILCMLHLSGYGIVYLPFELDIFALDNMNHKERH